MDAEEIQRRGQAILKAAQKDKESALVLSLLDELRKGVVATEDILRSTRIGVHVNKLRTHKDPQVQSQAGQLVNKWRNDVKKSSAGKGKTNGTASPAPAASTPTPAASKDTAPKVKPKHDVPPEKRNAATDKVNYKVTGSSIRDNCLKLMYDGLAHMSEEMPADVLQVARSVELAAYNKYQPETSEPYKSKMRSLYQNLKNKSNPKLRVRVLAAEITPERFVVMTHDELKSDERRAEDERLEKENMREAMVAQEEKTISTSLQCGKCKQKKVSYNQAQTRSADEPMTTFCECLVCGNRWKFS